MKWSEEYATGFERIDKQHKMIFKMSEDFRATLKEGAGEGVYSTLLDSISLYCRGHFGFEERCMDEYRCPSAQKNKKAHADFLEVLAGFQQRYAAEGYAETEAQSLIDTIDRWLSDHICQIDVHLKECVKE